MSSFWERLDDLNGVAGGTRFRLYPQAPVLDEFAQPETVRVSPPPGTIGPGPFDGAMRVVDAVDKPLPYHFPYMPPYRGALFQPALPGPDGHFDHIPLDSRQFLSAHMYGTVRFVIDVWEGYLGKTVDWYEPRDGFVVELVPDIPWDNAHAGLGFIETGGRYGRDGLYHPFALNFDVLAHEVGHTLLFSEMGVPGPAALTPQYLAFHESMSDLVALVSTLHFESIIDDLIDQTGGNLYVLNFLNRIGELSHSEQIRVASSDAHMRDVAELRLTAEGEWIDPSGQGRNAHHLAQPLTGAIFDCLVEIYQDGLESRGLLPPDMDPRGWSRESVTLSLARLQGLHEDAIARNRDAFLDALFEARDVVGFALALCWRRLRSDDLTFGRAVRTFLDVMAVLGQAHNLPAFAADFRARGIDLGAHHREDAGPRQIHTASYAQRCCWMRRCAGGPAPAAAALPVGAASEAVYGRLDHSFRLEA